MKTLDEGYTVEIDCTDRGSWENLLLSFQDASFYQTGSYGAIHAGERGLSHLVLRKDGKVVSLAQARIVRVPLFHAGVAHITWGPLWKVVGETENTDHLRNSIRALRNEYVIRRGYYLRIIPALIQSEGNAVASKVFVEEGYSWSENPVQSVFLDLSPTLSEIRQRTDRKWRQGLQAAERRGMQFLEGTDENLCKMAVRVVKEMKGRKRFYGGGQLEAIAVHRSLPESLKLRLLVCIDGNKPIAALGWQTIGKTGLPLVAASGDKALKLGSSYVLWWRMIEYYKSHGFSIVDVGGVNKQRNPGGFLFKSHIKGKDFKGPEGYLGQFTACESIVSSWLLEAGSRMREAYVNLRRGLSRYLSRRHTADLPQGGVGDCGQTRASTTGTTPSEAEAQR